MNINYLLVGAVLFLVIFLIIYLIRRNRKDEKILEHDMNMAEMKPDEHTDNAKE